jgi:hypothetical protein
MTQHKTFREQVIDKFIAAFGEPEVGEFTPGKIYRWCLLRGPYAMSMFITIDSPEFPEMAHVLISDGAAHQAEPLAAVSVYTLPDADLLIQRITKQWKSVGKPPRPPEPSS